MKVGFTKVARYWHTIRYLRPVQILSRFKYFFRRPKIDLTPPGDLRIPAGNWIIPARRRQSMFSVDFFCFLNQTHQVTSVNDWNNQDWSKLWIYNLHYFDDLNAIDSDERVEWHRIFIDIWIDKNPV